MTCCPHCESADRLFSQRMAAANLRGYRRHGAEGMTKRLLDALRAMGVGGMTLLDVGGGIGVIQHELKAAGVTGITGVDASGAYVAIARQEAEKRGYVADVRYYHGDFVALADRIEAADIVTLDRVVCCYPDMEVLVSTAAAKTKRYLGLVYPRDRWWTKLGTEALNGFSRLRGEAFRTFIYPKADVERVAAAGALHKTFHYSGLFWQVVVFARLLCVFICAAGIGRLPVETLIRLIDMSA